jgi:hypothetical protein
VFYYSAFQLNIASDFELPELFTGSPLANIDCFIKKQDVIHTPDKVSKIGITYRVEKNLFFLSIPHIGAFEVRDGKTISISTAPLVDNETIRLFILGSCLSALLLQQGKYVVNGHVLAIGEHAYALLGYTGVGKSTLALALLNRGHTLLSSGLCVIDHHGQVLPGYARLILWSNTLKMFPENKPCSQIRPSLEKWYIDTENHFYSRPLQLRSAYFLSTYNQTQIQLSPIKGFEKFNEFRNATVHPNSIDHIIDLKTYQLQGMRIANHIYMAKLIRPDKGNTISKLTQTIDDDLKIQGCKNEYT